MGQKPAISGNLPGARTIGPEPLVRRNPLQGRSQDKVDRILAVTAVLADTVPLDSITMAQIAEAAGASFSSIYRFFPSKEAIFEAVAMASLTRLQARYEAYFNSPLTEDPGAIIDRAIDIYVDFAATEPGFRAMWIDGLGTAEFASLSQRVPNSAITMARAYSIKTLGYPETSELDLRLAIASTAATQILRFAFEDNGYPRDEVIAELKRWLKAGLLMLG
jgi:AcrR family transcriptional regulator